MMRGLLVALALAGLGGCFGDGCTDPVVTVTQAGPSADAVEWDPSWDSRFPHIHALLVAAAAGGNATGEVPDREQVDFEAALDQAWRDAGRAGQRPNGANLDTVRREGQGYTLFDQRMCV